MFYHQIGCHRFLGLSFLFDSLEIGCSMNQVGRGWVLPPHFLFSPQATGGNDSETCFVRKLWRLHCRNTWLLVSVRCKTLADPFYLLLGIILNLNAGSGHYDYSGTGIFQLFCSRETLLFVTFWA
jgi:hypothetical protein